MGDTKVGSESPANIRITLLIRSLHAGGAERQFVHLAKGLAGRGHCVQVLTFYPGGDFGRELIDSGVAHHSLNQAGRLGAITALWRAAAMIRAFRPQVVYSFMDIANLYALLLRPVIRWVPIVWGIRSSFMDPAPYDLAVRMILKVEAALTPLPKLVICNSRSGAAMRTTLARGLTKVIVVENGIDCSSLGPAGTSGAAAAQAPHNERKRPVFGIVGRLDLVKDHRTFLRAAQLIASTKGNEVSFLIVGGGDPGYLAGLQSYAAQLKIDHLTAWAGQVRGSMAEVYQSLTVLISSSTTEGFSNVIAEAMACGVPCVVTDVGDSAEIVGKWGRVVGIGDAESIAKAAIELVDADSEACRQERAQSILDRYALPRMVERTESALMDVVGDAGHG